MNIKNLANRFELHKLEERTEFYRSIRLGDDMSVEPHEFIIKTSDGKNIEMPNLTIIDGFTRTGAESYIYETTILGKEISIKIDGIE